MSDEITKTTDGRPSLIKSSSLLLNGQFSDPAYHNQRNFTDYVNHTNLTYRCDPWSHCVGVLLSNSPNT